MAAAAAGNTRSVQRELWAGCGQRASGCEPSTRCFYSGKSTVDRHSGLGAAEPFALCGRSPFNADHCQLKVMHSQARGLRPGLERPTLRRAEGRGDENSQSRSRPWGLHFQSAKQHALLLPVYQVLLPLSDPVSSVCTFHRQGERHPHQHLSMALLLFQWKLN